MSSWISNMRPFARGNQRVNTPGSKLGSTSLSPSPTASPSVVIDNPFNQSGAMSSNKPPMFFREQYANLIVKGNFMTLAAKPVLVEEGEWLAHQVVENSRLLDGLFRIFQDADRKTQQSICNQHTCPTMTAGPGVTYTWIDQNGQPVNIPAPDYIKYVQRWVNNKIADPAHFPTDTFSQTPPSLNSRATIDDDEKSGNWLGKVSGFPSTFPSEVRNMYRQMFRCYAHIYHAHWIACWNLNAYRELNTCFIHFVNVGRLFGLLNDKDLEPMAPLIDIWLEKGWLPRPSSSGAGSNRVTPTSRSGSTSSYHSSSAASSYLDEKKALG